MKTLILVLVLIAGLWARADEITLAADSWCPFTCDPAAGKKGLMVDITTQALSRLGHTVKYENLNWARSVKDTREGHFSAIVGAIKADAPDFIFPNESFAYQESCYFTKSDSKTSIKAPSDLKNLKLGLVQDYSYGEPLDSYLKSGSVRTKFEFVSGLETTKKLIQMLAADRIDAFIEDRSVIDYVLGGLVGPGVESLKAIKKINCQKSVPLYIAFSPVRKNSKELTKALDLEFRKMKKTGQIKSIIESYRLHKNKI